MIIPQDVDIETVTRDELIAAFIDDGFEPDLAEAFANLALGETPVEGEAID